MIIVLKVTIEFILLIMEGICWNCFFPMLYAKKTHYTGYRWIWALDRDQNELTVLAYDKSLPINNIIQKKLETIALSGNQAKKEKKW